MSGIKKILVVAGARPNFIKIALLMKQLKKQGRLNIALVHTGQHYDYRMSKVFFQELDIPKPDVYLNAGPGTHAEQTAKIMVAFEKTVLKEKPALIIVVGDVNSTMACALVAAKLKIRVAHVEAGLRSFDRAMPEEINRLVTDSISDYLFVSESSGLKNLRKEGVGQKKIFFVGNVMIDTLLANLKKIEVSKALESFKVSRKGYCIVTLHRPSNVDSAKGLSEVYDILDSIAKKIKIIYPIHPRTKKMMQANGYLDKFEQIENLRMIDPIGYLDFLKLVKHSKFTLTDSGGIQEETTMLKVPCLTMRENTERPVTISEGTNKLVGRNKRSILKSVDAILKNRWKKSKIPKYWDGKTASRIVSILKKSL